MHGHQGQHVWHFSRLPTKHKQGVLAPGLAAGDVGHAAHWGSHLVQGSHPQLVQQDGVTGVQGREGCRRAAQHVGETAGEGAGVAGARQHSQRGELGWLWLPGAMQVQVCGKDKGSMATLSRWC